jgi:hypothetical protein
MRREAVAHSFSVPVRIVPDDPDSTEMFPPVMDGTNYEMEDTAIAVSARPAALASAEALASTMPAGWHVEIPEEQAVPA